LHSHIRRGFIIIESALDKNRSAFTQGTRPLKDPTKFEKKNNPRSLNVSPFSVFHRGEKGFSNSTGETGETCRNSTASVENGNQDQIPLHSTIGLSDGFT